MGTSLEQRNDDGGADDEFRDLIRRQLELLGEDPDREGLLRTPERVAKSLAWLTRGYEMDVAHVVGTGLFESEGATNMVMVRDIELYSLCEHHMLPFFGKAHIAYIPNGKIVGIEQAAADRRGICAAAPGSGASDGTDRQRARRRVEPAGRRRGGRGVPPLHDDARRREAEFEDAHQRGARVVPLGSEDARRVSDAGVCAEGLIE